jgi:LysM repeat protein
MVIYFVKPGDTLWKIAKQFRSRVEDIARVNGIDDANNIYVGQQLYIPKFTKSRVAM